MIWLVLMVIGVYLVVAGVLVVALARAAGKPVPVPSPADEQSEIADRSA